MNEYEQEQEQEQEKKRIREQAAEKAYQQLKTGLTIMFIFLAIVCVIISQWIGIAALGIFLAVLGLWTLRSIKIVGPKEMAIKVILGVPVCFCNSGMHFIPFFFGTGLKKFPKKLYNLDYKARIVITVEGKYRGKKYGSQVIRVDAVAYLKYPQDNNLIRILESDIPTDDEKLLDWTEEAVIGSLRIAFGQKTWKEAAERLDNIKDIANENFQSTDGALLRAGYLKKDIKLTVKEIKLPEELEKALLTIDKKRLDKEAAPYEADQRAEETVGSVIQMIAKATGKKPKEVREEIEKDDDLKKEFRNLSQDLIKRRMAIDGKSFTDIRVEGAKGIDGSIMSFIALFKKLIAEESTSGEGKKNKKEELFH